MVADRRAVWQSEYIAPPYCAPAARALAFVFATVQTRPHALRHNPSLPITQTSFLACEVDVNIGGSGAYRSNMKVVWGALVAVSLLVSLLLCWLERQ